MSRNNFAISLFEIGDLCDCTFSWLCCCIALPLARSNLDGSEILFNTCCLSTIAARWLIRTAYGIEDQNNKCMNNYITPCICMPCTINQLYQTTKQYGRIPNGGKEFNVFHFGDQLETRDNCSFCCYALFCTQCAIGSALKKSVGVPFCMGCCCFTLCSAHNIIRYQYRIHGNDTVDECLIPLFGYGCFGIVSAVVGLVSFGLCCPCIFAVAIAPVVAYLTTLLQETDQRRGGENKRYLVGYIPAAGRTAAIASTAANTVAVVVQPRTPVENNQPAIVSDSDVVITNIEMQGYVATADNNIDNNIVYAEQVDEKQDPRLFY